MSSDKTGRFEDIDYEALAADIASRPPSKWVPIIHPELQNVRKNGDHSYTATWRTLGFVVSAGIEDDGKDWLHASVSRRNKQMPTYENLMDLKRLCIGEHHTAYQVFPPKDKYVNLASMHVLHLWSCLDGDVTPDFTRGFGTI